VSNADDSSIVNGNHRTDASRCHPVLVHARYLRVVSLQSCNASGLIFRRSAAAKPSQRYSHHLRLPPAVPW
jgi:hypothetical protein